jgi:ABC-2 type transport system ATP-binding protein
VDLPTIHTENLTKYYGSSRGIDGVNLSVNRGEIFGFLGPNGAGKSTMLRLLLNSLSPTKGSASVLGFDCQEEYVEAHKNIGSFSSDISLYEHMKGFELLAYLADLRGSINQEYTNYIAQKLQCDLSRPIHTLSSGNKTKVGLVAALMHRPKVLILDEPTTGLDPIVRQNVFGLLRDLRNEGCTVLLSSHDLTEVERICDRVAIIREGRLVAVTRIDDLQQANLHHLSIQFEKEIPPSAFSAEANVVSFSVDGTAIEMTVSGHLNNILQIANDYPITNLISRKSSLEEFFMHQYGDK